MKKQPCVLPSKSNIAKIILPDFGERNRRDWALYIVLRRYFLQQIVSFAITTQLGDKLDTLTQLTMLQCEMVTSKVVTMWPSIWFSWKSFYFSFNRKVEEAVEAADRAFRGWSELDPEARAKYLLKIADIIESRYRL